MTLGADILDRLQADLVGILKASIGMEHAYVFTGDEKDLSSKLERTFSPRTNSAGGKRGLGVHVLPVTVESAEENLPGPPLLLKLEIRCIENVMLNRGANGTKVTSSQAALYTVSALHHRIIGPVVLYADKEPVKPDQAEDGMSIHMATLFCRANGVSVAAKVALPSAEIQEGDTDLLALTCATDGAVIRYTLDGSYPGEDAAIYDEPFAVPDEGTTVRVVATADGMNPSDTFEFTINPSEPEP